MTAFNPANIPADILPLIFEHLVDRRDLHTCAQLSRTFNYAATPILYRDIDSRITKTRSGWPIVDHPGRTLLKKPHYARYVRTARAVGAVFPHMPELLGECCEALKLCVNLHSFTWVDDTPDLGNHDNFILSYLDAIRRHAVKEITIRTYLGLSDEVWAELIKLKGYCSISLWIMEGPPRILQGWSETLGPTLTHLELGRCAGVPASILVSVISHLPHLQSLRLKGAPTSAILEILTLLPQLHTLDTEYFGSLARASRYEDVPTASLRALTVRTSSVDVQGPRQLWPWILQLTPRPSLESFILNAFSTHGDLIMPRRFLLDLAAQHKHTLKHFNADSALLTIEDVQCLCTLFPALESLSCSLVLCSDAEQIEEATANAHNLRELRLWTNWVPTRFGSERGLIPFEEGLARKLMMREDSQLRAIGVGSKLYTGHWVRDPCQDELEFKVVCDVVHDI